MIRRIQKVINSCKQFCRWFWLSINSYKQECDQCAGTFWKVDLVPTSGDWWLCDNCISELFHEMRMTSISDGVKPETIMQAMNFLTRTFKSELTGRCGPNTVEQMHKAIVEHWLTNTKLAQECQREFQMTDSAPVLNSEQIATVLIAAATESIKDHEAKNGPTQFVSVPTGNLI